MTQADKVEQVIAEDVELAEAPLGYDIVVYGERAGSIEGRPGSLEYLVIEPHWQGKGAGRAALRTFVDRSRDADHDRVVTNNVTHEAMGHILATDGFTERTEAIGWEKQL